VGGGEGRIIGAVLGLIQAMQHLDNITKVGRGIAVALVLLSWRRESGRCCVAGVNQHARDCRWKIW
jgi:hypothetical protein